MGYWVRARPGHPYLAGAPILVAHRGGAALAPENTMAAFGSAVQRWGADMLEMDVRLTADGRVVVIHDSTVDRTTDGSGPVSAFSLSEIQELDAGHRFVDPEGRHSFRGRSVRIPTFEEVLESLPSVRMNVDAKEPAVARPLVDIIERHRATARVLVAAEYERSRRGARGYRGAWGASRGQIRWFWLLHRLAGGGPYTPAADVLQVPETWEGRTIVTQAFIREAHRRNIPVHVWTVDTPTDMRRLLEWGVDAIQTDRPDRLAAVLGEWCGRPLPPGLIQSGGAASTGRP